MGVWWEGNAWHTPDCRLAPQVRCLSMGKRFSAPPPSRSRGPGLPEARRGGVGAGRGGCGRILARNILYFGRASAGPAGWPP